MQGYSELEEQFVPESEIKTMLELLSSVINNLKNLAGDPTEAKIKSVYNKIAELAWLVSDSRAKNQINISKPILTIAPKLTAFKIKGNSNFLVKSIRLLNEIKFHIERLNKRVNQSYSDPVEPEN